MVLPLYDDNSDRRTFPFLNYVFIAINVLVFVVLQGFGENDKFTYAFSTVPREIVTGEDLKTEDRTIQDPVTRETVRIPGLQPTPISVYITLLTSMFMHGGIAHLLGNMLFLWIFGDNIEDAIGRIRYFIFYIVCGVLASLAHVFTVIALDGAGSDSAMIPSLGASGAISGVLGGYLLLFPRKRVLVLLFRVLTWVPAWVAIGIWFLFQLINGLGFLGGEQSGIAYGAHIGGFVAGLALIKIFAIGCDIPSGDRNEPSWR
jgi:membrane associated rhomboid family serine protease